MDFKIIKGLEYVTQDGDKAIIAVGDNIKITGSGHDGNEYHFMVVSGKFKGWNADATMIIVETLGFTANIYMSSINSVNDNPIPTKDSISVARMLQFSKTGEVFRVGDIVEVDRIVTGSDGYPVCEVVVGRLRDFGKLGASGRCIELDCSMPNTEMAVCALLKHIISMTHFSVTDDLTDIIEHAMRAMVASLQGRTIGKILTILNEDGQEVDRFAMRDMVAGTLKGGNESLRGSAPTPFTITPRVLSFIYASDDYSKISINLDVSTPFNTKFIEFDMSEIHLMWRDNDDDSSTCPVIYDSQVNDFRVEDAAYLVNGDIVTHACVGDIVTVMVGIKRNTFVETYRSYTGRVKILDKGKMTIDVDGEDVKAGLGDIAKMEIVRRRYEEENSK